MARATQYGDQKVEVLQEIGDRARSHAKPPTVRELAERFDLSPATMHSWLGKLSDEGLVEWTPGRHRSLRLSPLGSQQLSSPAAPSV